MESSSQECLRQDLLMEYLEDDKPMHDWLSGKTQDKAAKGEREGS